MSPLRRNHNGGGFAYRIFKMKFMKKNMGGMDRIVRIVVALIIGALYYFNVVEGTLAYVLLGLAAIFVATSFVSFCPLYSIFGLNTCKVKN